MTAPPHSSPPAQPPRPGTGRFLVFEGGEGAGKSTQIALLAATLRAAGEPVVTTREPGGTPGAEAIRHLFVEGAGNRWSAEADVLLVTAARADHVAQRIRPALAAGATVLCDRYVHSTLAYQGYGKGVPLSWLRQLHAFATGDLWPDRVFWLDLPAEEGLRRSTKRAGAGQREQRFEQLPTAYHQRVRAGFAALAAEDPRILRFDATQPIEDLAAAIAGAAGVRAPGAR